MDIKIKKYLYGEKYMMDTIEQIIKRNKFMTLKHNVDITEDPDIDVIIHQCNCFHVMGGGVAAALSQKWPQVYQADLCTEKGDKKKLGTYSCACIGNDDQHEELFIFNLYSQYTFGGELETNYDAMKKGLIDIFRFLSRSNPIGHDTWRVGIPYLIGCGLAGGDSKTVIDIIIDSYNEVNPKNITIIFDSLN